MRLDFFDMVNMPELVFDDWCEVKHNGKIVMAYSLCEPLSDGKFAELKAEYDNVVGVTRTYCEYAPEIKKCWFLIDENEAEFCDDVAELEGEGDENY